MTNHRGSQRGGRRSTRPSGQSRERRRSSEASQGDRLAYAFEMDAAEELLALLRDDEGDADEDVLDEVRAALDEPLEPRHAERHQLLLWLAPAEWEAVVATLEERPADAHLVRHVAHHLERRMAQRVERDR